MFYFDRFPIGMFLSLPLDNQLSVIYIWLTHLTSKRRQNDLIEFFFFFSRWNVSLARLHCWLIRSTCAKKSLDDDKLEQGNEIEFCKRENQLRLADVLSHFSAKQSGWWRTRGNDNASFDQNAFNKFLLSHQSVVQLRLHKCRIERERIKRARERERERETERERERKKSLRFYRR